MKLLIYFFLCLALDNNICNGATYYVTPHSPDPNCPNTEHCHTISEYAENDSLISNEDNIILLFLNGTHALFENLSFKIELKESVTLYPKTNATIMIQNNAHLIFERIDVVNLTGLEIVSSTRDYVYPWCTDDSDKSMVLFQVDTAFYQNLIFDQCSIAVQSVRAFNIEKINFSESWIYYYSNFTNNEENANQTIMLKESNFSLSTIAMLGIPSCENETDPSADHNIKFEIENCSLFNSFFTVQIESESTISVDISLKHTIVSSENGTYINPSNEYNVTGLHIDIASNVTLNLEMKKCELTGNDVGLAIAANDYASVDVDIEQCEFVGNGGDFPLIFSQKFGGIGLVFGKNTKANINISSTLISENKFIQVYIDDIVTIGDIINFECTIDKYNDGDITFQLANSYIIYAQPSEDDLFGLQVNILSAYVYIQNCGFENSPVEIGMSTSETTLEDSSFIQKGLFIRNPNATIHIDNCTFAHNNDTAIAMANSGQRVCITQTKIIENVNGIILFEQNQRSELLLKSCVFYENSGVSLGVLDLVFNTNPPETPTKIDAMNVTFANNENNFPQAGIVQVDATINLLIRDQCIFKNNKGSAIRVFTSNVSLQGVVTFQNNLAYQGAAISLTASMLIPLEANNNQDTMISFVNNRAKNVGGSIYINQPRYTDSISGSPCFYMMSITTTKNIIDFLANVTLEFHNNTAKYGGFDIYGATVNSNCVVNLDNLSEEKNYNSINLQYLLFRFDYNGTEEILSSTTSSPKRICLCDFGVQCANFTSIVYNIKHYPGETFNLSFIVAGLNFGAVTGTVYANLLPTTDNAKSSLGSGQDVHTFRVLHRCESIPFNILSNQSFETIVLTVNDSLVDQQGDAGAINTSIGEFNKNSVIPVALLTVPVYVNVTLLDCPAGFQQTKSLSCDCDATLKEITVSKCSLNEKKAYVSRSKNIWVKALPNPEEGIIGTKYCPFNYCNTIMEINLNESDLQCSLNHSGILCGGCPSNYSLVIGSSRCLKCSDNYGIFLVIAFAIMGIIFVITIKLLNLTVTAGLINGLLFYANIVWANQSLLFPPRQDTSTLLMILKIFLAWLNLDFGIEFCFIQYLDGYWKTWLQFAFPIYIWSIAGLIIVASNYSSKITRILGEWEAVLATLFLIAYTKLLRTILVAVQFTELYGSNNNNMLVWSFNGNIKFFSAKHSILFVVGVAVLLFLWLPYTFVLLFVQTFRKYSDRRFLRWVNKLKPMFDAYLGPLKNEHQYWVGLRLFVRLILVVASAILLSTTPYITAVLIIIVSSILCLFASIVYNKWLPTILDGCSLINLVMFSSGALFVEANEGNKDILACISVGIAFIIFLSIIACQIWTRLKGLKEKKRDTNNIDDYEDLDQQNAELYRSATFQDVSVPKLREPLLEVETRH